MDRRTIGIRIFFGLAIGANFGVFIGKAMGNFSLGIGIGALAGVSIGWFITAAILQHRKDRS
jgi:hypothetical protein